ncbi:MAG: TIR domain-containing protein [Pyrinomonadaceae bacterium]
MSNKQVNSNTKSTDATKKRTFISQADVPSVSLDQALRIPRAIADNYAGGSVTPLQLASALTVSPNAGPFKMLCGAAIAYGLTEGGYNAKQISLTGLGKRIVKPLAEGDDAEARREAVLKPRVIGELLRKYEGSPLPRHDIAMNVLEDMGVPQSRTETVYNLVIESARSVGLLRSIKDKEYVDLSGLPAPKNDQLAPDFEELSQDDSVYLPGSEMDQRPATFTAPAAPAVATGTLDSGLGRRVFITHGKDKAFIDPIKKLLAFGEMIPIVSVERESVSKPVPEKVMDDMRMCGAAIIHVADEVRLMDKDAKEHVVINANVLIEIGAAMALYGQRFILLVKDGVELPSNLQGLYQVRYQGDVLDGPATIQLLEAINNMKSVAIPGLRQPTGAE